MELIPYSCQNIVQADIDAVNKVLVSNYLTQGPTLPAFEDAFAARHQVAHGVAVSNATAGLHLAMLALGVGRGSKVWTTPNSFVASANCALYCGADIDFVDIDAHTRNISLNALRAKLDQANSENKLPQVIVPVDFAGLSADLREMRQLADKYHFCILEDASHATGGSYLGRAVGSQFADVTVFSFHAVKIITTGEGGMVVTNNSTIAARLRKLRTHGISRDEASWEAISHGPWYYEQSMLGYNYRMTEMQAALGLSQLARLDQLSLQRKEIADRYDELLMGLPLKLPAKLEDRESARHLYVVEIDDRATVKTRRSVFQYLRSQNIGVNVHYIPVHIHPFYVKMGFRYGDFPASEHYYERAISIPLYPALTPEKQRRVVVALQQALQA